MMLTPFLLLFSVFTSTGSGSCEAEYAALNTANNAFFEIALDLVSAMAFESVATDALEDCEEQTPGACGAEEQDLEDAQQLVADVTDALSEAAEAASDAGEAYDECVGGGPAEPDGPEDPEEPLLFEPPVT